MLGWRTVCAVEFEPYAASVLVARQNDKILAPFPVWDDVRSFDGFAWRGLVDVVSGGFPCQDISAAGKGAGIDGKRSGLWGEMHRIIGEVRPKFAFMENSPLLVGRGLARVIGDLAQIGYDAEWLVMGADDVGAPHVRKRIWILAHDADTNMHESAEQGREYKRTERIDGCRADGVEPRSGVDRNPYRGGKEKEREIQERQQASDTSRICGDVADADCLRELSSTKKRNQKRNGAGNGCEDVSDSVGVGLETIRIPGRSSEEFPPLGGDCADISDSANGRDVRRIRGICEAGKIEESTCYHRTGKKEYGVGQWWATEPDVGRVAHGVAARVDRIRCIGNGQVPLVATTAFLTLFNRIMKKKN